jgi:exosortase
LVNFESRISNLESRILNQVILSIHSMTNHTALKKQTLLFLGICLASVLVNLSLFRQLLAFSLKSDVASHIFFIPFLSLVLVLRNKSKIFSRIRLSGVPGGSLLLIAGAPLLLGTIVTHRLTDSDVLSLKTAAIVSFWIGAFILSYGLESFRRARFPMLFLFFMVPIPAGLLHVIISGLQAGSADVTAMLFKLTQTPYYRDGVSFILPRISIEIAAECSSIRSSLALLISCSLAAHLVLRTFWRKTFFVLLAVPWSMVKNGIRVAVLALLSIHIDRRFIVSSDLHHDGGIVFFVLALLLLWPVLWLLRRSERKLSHPEIRNSRFEIRNSKL